jgi:hypothetical protein
MVLLQSNVFVWSIIPEVFCRLSSFKAMFLCGALDQGCCVDGLPLELCFCVEHYHRVFCRWPFFKVMFLCGALDQRCSVDGTPLELCFCVEH